MHTVRFFSWMLSYNLPGFCVAGCMADYPQEKGQRTSKPKSAPNPLTEICFWKIASESLNSISWFLIKGPCFPTNAVTIKVIRKWWATITVTCLVNNNSMILTVYLGYYPQKMILGEPECAAVSKIIASIAKWSEKSRSSELSLSLAFF